MSYRDPFAEYEKEFLGREPKPGEKSMLTSYDEYLQFKEKIDHSPNLAVYVTEYINKYYNVQIVNEEKYYAFIDEWQKFGIDVGLCVTMYVKSHLEGDVRSVDIIYFHDEYGVIKTEMDRQADGLEPTSTEDKPIKVYTEADLHTTENDQKPVYQEPVYQEPVIESDNKITSDNIISLACTLGAIRDDVEKALEVIRSYSNVKEISYKEYKEMISSGYDSIATVWNSNLTEILVKMICNNNSLDTFYYINFTKYRDEVSTVVAKPVTESETVEESTATEPEITEESTIEEPTVEEPTVEEPVYKEPTVEELLEPGYDKNAFSRSDREYLARQKYLKSHPKTNTLNKHNFKRIGQYCYGAFHDIDKIMEYWTKYDNVVEIDFDKYNELKASKKYHTDSMMR